MLNVTILNSKNGKVAEFGILLPNTTTSLGEKVEKVYATSHSNYGLLKDCHP
ncbi:MAG: hypothetical protein H5T50_01895 [Nitrososphaeria archaeon]|nr:hypothetical protein [Nitrososphaeria archaeon]